MANYYQASGRFSVTSILYFLPLAALVAPLLAALYAFAIWYIQMGFFSFLVAVLLSFAISYITSEALVTWGKNRNPGLSAFMGAAVGLITLYVQWVFWTILADAKPDFFDFFEGKNIFLQKNSSDFLKNPLQLLLQIQEINVQQATSDTTWHSSALLLWAVWLLEALLLVLAPALSAMIAARAPFCETTNRWFDELKLPAFNFITNKELFLKKLEKNDRTVFDDLRRADQKNESHSIFSLYSSDEGTNYLTIRNEEAQEKDDDQLTFSSDELVEYIEISNALKNNLLEK